MNNSHVRYTRREVLKGAAAGIGSLLLSAASRQLVMAEAPSVVVTPIQGEKHDKPIVVRFARGGEAQSPVVFEVFSDPSCSVEGARGLLGVTGFVENPERVEGRCLDMYDRNGDHQYYVRARVPKIIRRFLRRGSFFAE